MDMLDFFAQVLRMKPQERRQLVGPTPRTAASILGVSRQRVYQLIKQGKLEVVELWDQPSDDPAESDLSSGPIAVMITRRSLRRFQNSDRRPGPKSAETSVRPAKVARARAKTK